MKELMTSPYFGVGLSVVAFWIGEKLHSKLKTPICNPLIVSIVLIVGVLLIFDIPYDSYDVGGALINMFLAPATACLAVAIYTKIDVLKKYWLPIVVGCTAGSAASMASVFGMCKLFGLDQSMTNLLNISVPNYFLLKNKYYKSLFSNCLIFTFDYCPSAVRNGHKALKTKYVLLLFPNMALIQ